MSEIRGLALTAAMVGVFAAPAAAQSSVENFYKGKTVDMFIGYSAGGGYDTYGRIVARHMGKHIPGNPNVLPRNLPGAGSLLLVNQLYNTLPKDGTAIGIFARAAAWEPLFGNKQAKFDPTKMNWLGSGNNEVSICAFWHTAGLTSTEQFLTTPLVVGGTGPGADTDNFPLTLNNVLHTKLKLITGYPGGNDVNIAIERGEVQGRCGWSWSSVKSTRPDWLRDKKIFIPVQFALSKHKDLPDVPLVLDLAKTEEQRNILEVIFSGQPMGRPFALGPNVPPERVKALRAAFDATFKDKEFLAEAEKAKLEIDPGSGEEVEAIVNRVDNMPPELLKAAWEASTRKDRIQIEKKK
jgi:tripartite-type tricarboxylate transporter receptor subunit TctC